MPYDPDFPMIFIPDDKEKDISWKSIIIIIFTIIIFLVIIYKLIEYGLHT